MGNRDEWGRESQRDAVTRGDSVFILVFQRSVDPGGGAKEDEFQYGKSLV